MALVLLYNSSVNLVNHNRELDSTSSSNAQSKPRMTVRSLPSCPNRAAAPPAADGPPKPWWHSPPRCIFELILVHHDRPQSGTASPDPGREKARLPAHTGQFGIGRGSCLPAWHALLFTACVWRPYLRLFAATSHKDCARAPRSSPNSTSLLLQVERVLS